LRSHWRAETVLKCCDLFFPPAWGAVRCWRRSSSCPNARLLYLFASLVHCFWIGAIYFSILLRTRLPRSFDCAHQHPCRVLSLWIIATLSSTAAQR
jgi:hypothetical protein